MSSNATARASSGGVGIAGLLTAIFAAAKVFGFWNVSWWIVFLPLIVSFGLGVLILLFVALFAVVVWMID